MHLFPLLSAACTVVVSAAPLFSCGALSVALDFSYAVAPWLSGGDVAVRASGAWWSASAGTLIATSNGTRSGVDPRRGAFSALDVSWVASDAPATPVTTTFRCFPGSGVVSFVLAFPAGAPAVATSACPPPVSDVMYNASRAPSARFPSFRADAALEARAFVEWLGDWAFEGNAIDVNVSARMRGGQAAGPLVLFDAAAGPAAAALVISPADRFRTTILAPVPAIAPAVGTALAAGPQGYITELPAGYAQEVIAVASPAGVTDAMARWGDALQRAHATVRLPPSRDVWTSRLTYFTSNGAFYSDTWFANNASATAEGVLLALAAYHRAAALPVAAYELDPFWMPCGAAGPNGGSPLDWAPRADRFPRGFAPLVDAGLRFMLYGAYWAPPPFNAFPNYTWAVSQAMPDGPLRIAGIAANESRAFYGDLIRRAQSWGVAGIETDWMMKDIAGFTDLQTRVGAVDEWWAGAADAALAAGVPWQLCLNWAADVMMALAHPAVTHIRVSIDNEPRHFPNRWRMAQTALLHGVLAVRPFNDVVLTTSPQPGLPYPFTPTGLTSYPELTLVLAALSTGPVGIGDGLGLTNASLVAAACAADGSLLQPSGPATFVDEQFADDLGVGGNGAGARGTLVQAHSFIPARIAGLAEDAVWDFATALAVDVPAARALGPASFTPPLLGGAPRAVPYARAWTLGRNASLTLLPAANATWLAARWSPGFTQLAAACARGAPARACVAAVSADSPLDVATGPGGGASAPFDHDIELLSLAPLLESGWALIGELSKVVRVSPARFHWLSDSPAGPAFGLRAAPAERVNVTLVSGGADGVVVRADLHGGDVGGDFVVRCGGVGIGAACVAQGKEGGGAGPRLGGVGGGL
jgi:hypothetical protein